MNRGMSSVSLLVGREGALAFPNTSKSTHSTLDFTKTIFSSFTYLFHTDQKYDINIIKIGKKYYLKILAQKYTAFY